MIGQKVPRFAAFTGWMLHSSTTAQLKSSIGLTRVVNERHWMAQRIDRRVNQE